MQDDTFDYAIRGWPLASDNRDTLVRMAIAWLVA
jgi:hypothetical protein